MPNTEGLNALRILAVDDERANLLLLERILGRAGYTQVETMMDPSGVASRMEEVRPDLLLLDLHMPQMDGFDLMERLAPLTGAGNDVPVLVLTADTSDLTRRRALAAGARDFLTKPLDPVELMLRVRNVLQVQQLQNWLREQNESLEDDVTSRTQEVEQARLETLDRLALAAEYRDDATHQHARRIGDTCALLGAGVGFPDEDVELLRSAAPLHDIGKIGIPDEILLKPDRLHPDEFEQMKAHTAIGAEILSGSHSPVLRLAEVIALTHHERWDGRGYPSGLSGEDIPLPGRIAAVADVFDALTHERPYKAAWSVESSVAEILDQPGRRFDPRLVEVFAGLDHEALVHHSAMSSEPMEAAATSSWTAAAVRWTYSAR